MIHHCKDGAAGVLLDHGTGLAIRFAVWYDDETGDYEALKVASNGQDYACDERYKAIRYRGKAKGKLELISLGDARLLGKVNPQKVPEVVATPLPHGAKQQGLEDYKRLYFHVWNQRGDAMKCVDQRWIDFLKNNTFLDHLILRKGRLVTT